MNIVFPESFIRMKGLHDLSNREQDMDWIELATGVRKRIKREKRGEKYE